MAPQTTRSPRTVRTLRTLRCLAGLTLIATGLVARQSAAQSSTHLPAPLRAALARAGCRVPEAPSALTPDSLAAISHVAYRAALLSTDTTAWAVVCERGDRRDVLLYEPPITASRRPTARLALEWSPSDEGCDGWIELADSALVRAALQKAQARSPSTLDRMERGRPLHTGIIDSMCEGAALHYWSGRRWIKLASSWEAP